MRTIKITTAFVTASLAVKWKLQTSKLPLNFKALKLIEILYFRILCDLQATNGSSLSDLQNEVQDGANLTQIIGTLTQMIARDLQRARNTRLTEGNEPNLNEVRSNGNNRS